MQKLYHTPRYTIRQVEGPAEVQQDAWDAIIEATEYAFNHLNLAGHLFVTVIGADVLGDPENCGFAMYHSGIQHAAVCGGDGPDEFKDCRHQWLDELRISTVHEIVHYWQDLMGTLDGGDENEDEAERMSRDIVSSMTDAFKGCDYLLGDLN